MIGDLVATKPLIKAPLPVSLLKAWYRSRPHQARRFGTTTMSRWPLTTAGEAPRPPASALTAVGPRRAAWTPRAWLSREAPWPSWRRCRQDSCRASRSSSSALAVARYSGKGRISTACSASFRKCCTSARTK